MTAAQKIKALRDLMTKIAGKTIHPVFGLPGGISKPLTPEIIAEAKAVADVAVEHQRERLALDLEDRDRRPLGLLGQGRDAIDAVLDVGQRLAHGVGVRSDFRLLANQGAVDIRKMKAL